MENRQDCESCPHKSSSSPKSYGTWSTEEQSVSFLLSLLNESELFKIYREISGQVLHPRLDVDQKSVRIDMILSPTPKLLKAGWDCGPFGVECKRSGEDLSKAFVQCLDYSRTIWELPSGYRFMCKHFFVWPFHRNLGFVESVMAHMRIGIVFHKEWSNLVTLKFQMGSLNAIEWKQEGNTVEVNQIPCGDKCGSR